MVAHRKGVTKGSALKEAGQARAIASKPRSIARPDAAGDARRVLSHEVPTLLRTIAAVLREAGVDETSLREAFAGATTAARTAPADHPDALAGSVIELWNSDPE